MVARDAGRRPLDLADLPPQAREAIEALLAGGETEVRRDGVPIGTLAFRPAVLEGVLVEPEARPGSEAGDPPVPPPPREDVTVVATTMRMTEEARRRLGDALGESYLVVDFADAPPTTDVVLGHAVSHQLVGAWAQMFPQARIVVTEILDAELGLDVRGPVGVLLDAGADAYLPPRPIEEVARNVHRYLVGQDRPALASGDGSVTGLPPADPSG